MKLSYLEPDTPSLRRAGTKTILSNDTRENISVFNADWCVWRNLSFLHGKLAALLWQNFRFMAGFHESGPKLNEPLMATLLSCRTPPLFQTCLTSADFLCL